MPFLYDNGAMDRVSVEILYTYVLGSADGLRHLNRKCLLCVCFVE